MKTIRNAMIVAAVATGFGWAAPAAAHCDTLDGPVVGAARQALDTGQVEHALIWVQRDDERAIRDAFTSAMKARKAGGAAAERADTSFYATLVKVHRKGEGAPYTGLKAAGTIEPPIAAADRSLASGHPAEVEHLIVERAATGLRERFEAAAEKRSFAPTDVAAGRAYVGAYVDFMHHVERLYDAAGVSASHAHAAGQAASKSVDTHKAPAASARKHQH
jgi:hypothetical protein